MSRKLTSSLEDTISIYKNKYLIDLDEEDEDSPILDENNSQLTSASHANLRTEQEDVEGDSTNRGRRGRLPRDLAGLMGQANVSFARGEHNDAILMCQEVIRLAPRCPDPFISLAEYYMDIEDEEKAEQLYLIAAYLQPSDPELWVKVAESATRRREFRLAASCYTRAIRAEKNDPCIHYHLQRCNLYEKLGDQRKALRGYEHLITVLGPDDEQFGLDLARGIARIYKTENKVDDCIRALENAIEKYTNQITSEDITLLSSCYNTKKDYPKTINLVVRFCGVNVDRVEGNQFIKKITTNLRHPRMTFDIRCLLIVALISTDCSDEAIKPLVKNLDSIEVSSHRQSLYEVAQAYFLKRSYVEAKVILIRLTTHRDSQSASIWLLYSRCLNELSELDEAIVGYRKVLSYEPDDYSSRLALANLLIVQGRSHEALEVTTQPLSTEKPVDIPLLFQTCQLLEQLEKWEDYSKAAKALMMTDMLYTCHPKEIMSLVTSRSQKTRIENLKAVQRELLRDPYEYRQKFIGAKLDSQTMLKIFLRYIQVLFKYRRDFKEIERICFSALTCSALECYESSIDFYTAVACVINEDKEITYHHLKTLASRNLDNNQAWNILSMAMNNIYGDLRHGRFCLRLSVKNPEVTPLAFFNSHNALISGSYKQALEEYMNIFKEQPNDAFTVFCIALTYLSLSCQRYVSSKYLCLFQMIAFLHTYLELRGTCQETMYNIGRAFHQMNMLDKAVIFYKKAIRMYDRSRIHSLHRSAEELDQIFDIRREAAFNLALIFKNSQSYGLAYQIIKDNFTI